MATKEKLRRLRFGRQESLPRQAVMNWAECGVGFLLGAVLAGAEIFGRYAPFGVAAVAAAGSGLRGVCTLAGSCLGYLCLEGMTDGMRYAASGVLVYSVAFAFFDARVYQKGWFMPGVASLISALTGIICRGGQGWYGEDLIYFVTEVLFTGAAAYGYRVLFRRWPDALEGPGELRPREGAGVLILAGTVLMSLARVEVLGTFSLGRLLAAVGTMYAARRGAKEGVLAGACAGVALDLASGEPPYYSMVYALSGLACGLCGQKGKGATALIYTLATIAAVLWTWDGGEHFGMLLETLVGVGLFLPLPQKEKARERPAALTAGGEEAGAVLASKRMSGLAEAFHSLYDQVKESLAPEESSGENPAEIFTRAVDKVCARCTLRSSCWQQNYQETRGLLNDVTGPVLERGRALATDFAGRFSERCAHFPEFLGEVNRALTVYLRRRQEMHRSRETRMALCSQYARLDQFMTRAAAEVSTALTPDLPRQEKLRSYLKSFGVEGGSVYYDRGGRLQVITPVIEELKSKAVRRELAQLLEMPLYPAEEEGGQLIFAQAEPFRTTVAMAGAPRKGERISGDTGLWFRREDGMLFLLLCDGMGSGAEAREESQRAAKLIERFLKAGMDPDEAVETVSCALALRGADMGSTTVDLLSIDLFSGRCCVHKQGAAPTYVRRDQQIKCAVGASPPVGIFTGVKPDAHKFRGEAGDWIVLLTDGILCGREDGWLRNVMNGYQGTSPSEMAERILHQAQQLHQEEDDATVIAVRLEIGREKSAVS